MAKKMTTDEFITKARQVHGDRYDYSATEYVNLSNSIEITCPIHGKFIQKASTHLKSGCTLCKTDAKINDVRQITPKPVQIFTPEEIVGERIIETPVEIPATTKAKSKVKSKEKIEDVFDSSTKTIYLKTGVITKEHEEYMQNGWKVIG